MSKALSLDLRQRTLAPVREEGLSHREAAVRFKVSAASVSRRRALAAKGGEPVAGPLGDDRRSQAVEAAAETILEVFHAQRDMTLAELRAELAKQGLCFGYGTLWRFFDRRGYTHETAHAAEQQRPDILTRREAWFERQLDLDPQRLVREAARTIDTLWAAIGRILDLVTRIPEHVRRSRIWSRPEGLGSSRSYSRHGRYSAGGCRVSC